MGAANSGSSTSTNYVGNRSDLHTLDREAMYSSYTLGDNKVLCA